MTNSIADEASFASAALNLSSAHIAIVDITGVIVYTNATWRKFALDNGSTMSDCL